MAIASLIIAIAAIFIAIASALYARRQASAAEGALRIERDRRHEERRPDLTGTVDSLSGQSYELRITLPADACTLSAMEVRIRQGQGVAFVHGALGVFAVASETEIPLRAFAFSAKDGSAAVVHPGQVAQWLVDVTETHLSGIWADVTCHADDGDLWTVAIEAPVQPRLTNTMW